MPRVCCGLGPLADNGGPTQTMALLPGSPCIDAGDLAAAPASPPDFDQRGAPFLRVSDGRIDIGAYELQQPPAVVLQNLLVRVAPAAQDGALNSGQRTALSNPLKNAASQLAASQTKQAVQSLTTFINQVNARINALNPKDADYAAKLAERQTLLNEAQSIIAPLLAS